MKPGKKPNPNDHEIAKLVREIIRTEGWDVRQTRGRHYQAIAPDRVTMVTFSSTPGKRNRSVKNAKAKLRRVGFEFKSETQRGKKPRNEKKA